MSHEATYGYYEPSHVCDTSSHVNTVNKEGTLRQESTWMGDCLETPYAAGIG